MGYSHFTAACESRINRRVRTIQEIRERLEAYSKEPESSYTALAARAKKAGVKLDQPMISRIALGKRDLSYEEARWLLPILWPDDPAVSGVSMEQMEREIDRAAAFLEKTWARTSQRAGIPAEAVQVVAEVVGSCVRAWRSRPASDPMADPDNLVELFWSARPGTGQHQ